MDWPGNNPDLNPIEHMWDELGQRKLSNNLQLADALLQEWEQIYLNKEVNQQYAR